jgi:hypothetical protein
MRSRKVAYHGMLTETDMVMSLWLTLEQVAEREQVSLHAVKTAYREERLFPAMMTPKGIRVAPVYVLAPPVPLLKGERKERPKPTPFKAAPLTLVRTNVGTNGTRLWYKHLSGTYTTDTSKPRENARKVHKRKRPTVVMDAVGSPQTDDDQAGGSSST